MENLAPTTYSLYKGNIVLTFDPTKSRNRYTIKGQKDKPMSVSQIANMADKSPMLLPWQLKVIKKYLADFYAVSAKESYTKTETLELIDLALARPEIEKNEAGKLGHDTHAWLLEFARAKMTGKEVPPLPENPIIQKCLNGFLTWYNSHDVIFVEVEQPIYSRQNNYVGTLDVIAIVDGVLTLLDYKTSKSLYPSYLTQLAGYKEAKEEEWRHDSDPKEVARGNFMPRTIEQGMLMHLDKENGEFNEPVIIKDFQPLFEGFYYALQFKLRERTAGKMLRSAKKEAEADDTLEEFTEKMLKKFDLVVKEAEETNE